jgi:hypothetical protein
VAHHQPRELPRVGFLDLDGGDGAALPQDRHAIGDGEDLGKLVRDEDDGPAVGDQLADAGEELLGLGRGEDGGGLVQDQDVRAAIERLQDVDPLALAERELPDLCPRIHVHLEARRDLGDLRLHLAGGEAEAAVPGPAQHHVLRDGQALDQAEVLVNHEHAGQLGLTRRVKPDRPAIDPYLPLVGAIKAGQDVTERGLARAVLAQERVHLAAPRLERNPVVGDHAAGEALGDAHRRHRRSRPGGGDGCGRGARLDSRDVQRHSFAPQFRGQTRSISPWGCRSRPARTS